MTIIVLQNEIGVGRREPLLLQATEAEVAIVWAGILPEQRMVSFRYLTGIIHISYQILWINLILPIKHIRDSEPDSQVTNGPLVVITH